MFYVILKTKTIISLHWIRRPVFLTKRCCIPCALWTGSLYRESYLSPHPKRWVYRVESPHPPGHPVAVAVIMTETHETRCAIATILCKRPIFSLSTWYRPQTVLEDVGLAGCYQLQAGHRVLLPAIRPTKTLFFAERHCLKWWTCIWLWNT
jgi:hypothetical protein